MVSSFIPLDLSTNHCQSAVFHPPIFHKRITSLNRKNSDSKIINKFAAIGQMSKGLIWATAEDLARNRGKVLSLYRQVLRSLNSPDLPLNLAARLHRKAQARAIFMVAAEERSIHNIKDLMDIADYSLSLLRKGEIPKYIQ